MADDDCVERDRFRSVFSSELPVDEVGGVFASWGSFSWVAAVDEDVSAVGGDDEDTVTLADVNEVDLE